MRRLIALFLLLPTLLWAQSYPDYESTTVNDFAGLLTPEAEARLDTQLSDLRKETGVEMTVVTLSRQAVFAPDQTLEQFATGLFNHWGVGNAQSNDGVMVLVLHSDRAMRIELGDAYDRDWDRAAARVIDRAFLPAFREDRYQDGIEAGVSDTIRTIVMPFQDGSAAPSGSSIGDWVVKALFGVFGAGFLAVIFKDKFVKLKRCPSCGTRGLSRSRKVLRSASKTSTGDGEMTTRCANCTYLDVRPYTISRISSSSGSSFGGGSSGGGGASGRW